MGPTAYAQATQSCTRSGFAADNRCQEQVIQLCKRDLAAVLFKGCEKQSSQLLRCCCNVQSMLGAGLVDVPIGKYLLQLHKGCFEASSEAAQLAMVSKSPFRPSLTVPAPYKGAHHLAGHPSRGTALALRTEVHRHKNKAARDTMRLKTS